MSATWDTKGLKGTPIAADEILIIDTANSRNQKRATLTSLSGVAGPWSRNAGSGFIFPTVLTDKVGIGITIPTVPLHVVGAGKFTGALDMTSQLINNVLNPVSAQDAATKNYVDTHTANAIWTKSGVNISTTTADDHVTLGNGTELLPAYSFTNFPSYGIRAETDALAFSVKGFDALKLTADANAVNFLSINAGADDFTVGFVTLSTVGASSDLTLKLISPSGMELNSGTGGGRVTVGKNNLALFDDTGSVAFGTGFVNADNVKGRVLHLRADTALFSQTEIHIQSPNTSRNFEVTVEDEVTTGFVTLGVTDSNTFNRASGSFITEGFSAGQTITTLGFVNSQNNGTFVVASVSISTLDITTTPLLAEAQAGGRVIQEVDTGDVTLVTDGEELHLDTIAGNAATIADRRLGLGGRPISDFTVFQQSDLTKKGITLSGEGVSGSSTTDGIVLLAGNIVDTNMQLWVGQKSHIGDGTKTFFRYLVGKEVPIIDGVNGNNTLVKNIGIAQSGGKLGVGFDFGALQSDIQAKLHVKAGSISEIAQIIQAFGTQTVDLFQVRNSAGAAQVVIDENFRLGIGITNPTVPLHVVGAGKFTGALDMTSQLINNVLDPVSLQDAATKNYVDTTSLTKVGTPADNQVAIWTGDGTIEGDTDLLFNTSTNTLNVGIGSSGGGNLVVDAFFTPTFEMKESDATADNKRWRLFIDNGIITHELLTDGGVGTAYKTITRSGSTATSVAFTTNSLTTSGNFAVDTDTLFVDAANDTVQIGGTGSLTDLSIIQNSTLTKKGLTFTEPGLPTDGVVVYGGNIGVGNMQLWIGQKSDLGNSTKKFFRYTTGIDVPNVSAVNGTNVINHHLNLGNTVSNVGVGFSTTAVQADIQGNLHVKAGSTSNIAAIIQAFGTQTVDLFQVRSSAGGAQIVIDENFRLGLGVPNPQERLDVAGSALITGDLTIGSTGLFVNVTEKRVAIGHASPSVALDVIGAGKFTGALDMTSQLINNVLDPVSAQDAATKNYHDTTVPQTLKWKEPVRATTTINGILVSGFNTGDAIDGISLATGDRILIKNQTTGSENGIYTVNVSGAPTRATDFDANTEVSGAVTHILEGDTNIGQFWKLTNTGAIVVGTTALNFVHSHDSKNLIHIYNTNDWGVAALAPDGNMRVPLLPATTYRIHTSNNLPLLLMPIVPTADDFNIIDFEFVNSSVNLFCNSTTTAQIWGRNNGGLLSKEGNFVDVGGEGGEVSTLFDLVGVDMNALIAMQFTFLGFFKSLGHTVNMFHDHTDSLFSDNTAGFVVRNTSTVNSDNLVRAVTFRHDSTSATPTKPVYSILGNPNSNQFGAGTIDLVSGQDYIYLDAGLVSETEIVGNPYSGVAKGNFFQAAKVKSITAQANADVSFASVAAGGAGEIVITFAAIQDFIIGQFVLIKGDTNTDYDGLVEIIAVSNDQKSFTFTDTFTITQTGNFQMVQHTVASPNPYVRDATVVVTGTTSYNTSPSLKILRETDTTFHLPQAFVANDATGSVTTNPLNEKTVGVHVLSNGHQPNSIISGEMHFLNMGGQTITINTAGTAEKIGTTSWTSDTLQRTSVSTAGLMTYLGVTPEEMLVNFSATIERVTGTPTLGIGVGLFKNGALISGFDFARSFNAGKVQINGTRTVPMIQNDTFEIVVINFDNTVNIDVFQADAIVNQLT